MFLSQCSLKYTFNIIPFLLIFHEKKGDERYENIQNRKGVTRAEQDLRVPCVSHLQINENTRR